MTTENDTAAASGDTGDALAGGTSLSDALADIESGLESEGAVADEGAEGAEGSEGDAEGEPKPGSSDPKGSTPPAEDKGKSGDPSANPDPNDKPPDTWRKEASAEWAGVPPGVKAEIAKREADIAKFVSDNHPRIAVADALEKKVGHLVPFYQKNGMDIWQVLPDVLQGYAVMQFGKPEHKVQMFQAMAKDMGIDIAALQAGNPQGAINPEVDTLKTRIRELENGVRSVTSNLGAAEHAKLVQQVETFASDPKNIYFTEVAVHMQQLLNSGVAKTLEDAYDKAVWSNPVTRQKAVDAETKVRAEAAARKAAEKTTQARKAAAVNVKARNSGGRATSSDDSIDETLASTLAEIRSRA